MNLRIRLLTVILTLLCFVVSASAQEMSPAAISLQTGVGNSLSLKQLAQDDTAFNLPNAAFMHARLAVNFPSRNQRSTYLGLELQTANFYPSSFVKTNLSYATLYLGKTRRFDVTRELYFLYTGAFGLSSLVAISTSANAHNIYSGGPFKNGNLAILNMLQTMLATPQTRTGSFDVGLGLEIGLHTGPIYHDKDFPPYLKPSTFLQYGLNLNMRYNFRTHVALQH